MQYPREGNGDSKTTWKNKRIPRGEPSGGSRGPELYIRTYGTTPERKEVTSVRIRPTQFLRLSPNPVSGENTIAGKRAYKSFIISSRSWFRSSGAPMYNSYNNSAVLIIITIAIAAI